MYIHNFYADLLLSVRILFDTYILKNPNYIRRYEFNIGNRTFQLPKDFKTTYEFPNIMVSLGDESLAMGQRPEVSQSIAGWNVDQIPVLYDTNKQNILYVQEEMVNIPITATVNCESQLQVKEIANVVKRWLPFNKFIQFLEYTSFLEISEEFLGNNLFDIDSGSIANLYTKLNKRSGRVEHCFSLTYKPFIRLDSISTNIPDSTQRSFQAVVDFTYMIQFPLYLYNDQQPTTNVERVDFAIAATAGFEPIADQPSSKIINWSSSEDLRKGYIKRQYIVYDNVNTRLCVSDITSATLMYGEITVESADKRILLTLGADDCLYITLDSTTRFKVAVSNITEEGISIPVDTDYNFLVTKNSHGDITVTLLCSWHCVKICFSKDDFLITSNYSYNLIKGSVLEKNYPHYVVDIENNCVECGFKNSSWITFEPSIVDPLFVQFYLTTGTFTHQFGGVPAMTSNLKISGSSSNAVVITWTSGVRTTSCIEYGLTTSYGNFSEIKQKFEYTHQIVLYGLAADTTYHYRVNTTDEDNNLIISDDASFTTDP